ncbi:MAG: SDR family oxidoreductase [Bradymonadales bacterium]|nr:SDR family oxidoreductase [Bradymonadales bacterium]
MKPRRRPPAKQKLVITGISGRMGRLLARRLHKEYEIIGIDRRGSRYLPKNVTVYQMDIRRKACEDIFRKGGIGAVIHLNIVHDLRKDAEEHHSFNVVGTHKLLDYCAKHNVPKFVLLSSANVYGASPNNNQFLNEEAPLLGASTFSGIRDLIEVDIYTNSFFWRHPEIDTVILRPVNILGHLSNAPSNYLRLKNPPTILGFDPMMQVIHVEDLIEAIVLSLKPGVRGVFNIAGPGAIALSVLHKQLGRTKIPIPELIAKPLVKLLWNLRVSALTPAELDFLKYVCMVDDRRAREVLNYRPQKSLRETIEVVRF